MRSLPAIMTLLAVGAPAQDTSGASPGSTFSSGGPLANAVRDLRAAQPGDLLTIVVADRATAVTKGNTTSARKGSASASIGSLFGVTRAPGPLADMARLSGARDLQGQGETSRENNLTTTLSARVLSVMSNGNLLVEGRKEVRVNGETQVVEIRGLARTFDISPGNLLRSDRLAELQVRVDGKGVVNDAVKRPNFLYRILLGLLPY